jgi:adenine phosphoribosyltransferase
MDQVKESIRQYLKNNIRNIPDFPKAGIQFKDITTLLKDPDALQLTSDLLKRPFIREHIDYVAGIESRGFLFGSRLAQDLNAGFIAIRKPGKLPGETISAEYELEYGTNTLEIHNDAIHSGASVVIHDDLIATGGSAKAATALVQKLGGRVAGYSFIMELKALEGCKKLPEDTIIDTLVGL